MDENSDTIAPSGPGLEPVQRVGRDRELLARASTIRSPSTQSSTAAAAAEGLLLARRAVERRMAVLRAQLPRREHELLRAVAVGVHVDEQLQADLARAARARSRRPRSHARSSAVSTIPAAASSLRRVALRALVLVARMITVRPERHAYARDGRARRRDGRSIERAAKGASMKTSLGIWAFGAMATRFNPGGYKPRARRRDDRREGADGRRGARRPDGRLRVPLPAGALARQPRRGAARRSTGTASTASRAGLHLDPRFAKGGFSSPDDATRDEALRLTLEAIDLAGELGAHMIIWPGIEGYNYPFQTPYAESWARFIDGVGEVGAACARPRRDRSSSSTRTPSRR